jgi:hypothetical protein
MKGDNDTASELARLLEHYHETLEPPSDEELRKALKCRWPLGMVAKMVAADGLEAEQSIPMPPPPKWERPLQLPRSSMVSDSAAPTSAPTILTRVYELVHVDLELGGCIYQEVLDVRLR